MKVKILFIVCVVVIAAPWLFLLEVLPVPYGQISTALEVTIEGVMFAALLAAVVLLRKELKRLKAVHEEGHKAARVVGRILFVLASVTLFIVGLILALIAISFTL
jgi:TRAP-type C4-dicarboxylate transport system permease small subunit